MIIVIEEDPDENSAKKKKKRRVEHDSLPSGYLGFNYFLKHYSISASKPQQSSRKKTTQMGILEV